MAQPTRRGEDVGAAGEIMSERGDFWVPNPWSYPGDQNLSAFEPNIVCLNLGAMKFLDITWISGAGWVGDGRGALVADVDGDLQPDLIARNVGGGSVRVYANRFPPASRLTVTLEGTKSNRLGVGARIVARAGDLAVTRHVFPINNFAVQQASRARFGLGRAKQADTLVVHWPSGVVQELKDVPTGLHIRIREGDPSYTVVARAR